MAKSGWRWLAAAAAVRPEEKALAGRIIGILCSIGALSSLLFWLLPGTSFNRPVQVLILDGLAAAWGYSALRLIDWRRTGAWLVHACTVAALVAVALAVEATGGAGSTSWIYLLFVILFVSYFYRRRMAVVYVGLVILTHLSVLLYDPGALHAQSYVSQLVAACAAYVSLAVAIMAGKSLTLGLRFRAEALAAEQSALRRLATAVVDRRPPEEIYALVSSETAALLQAPAAGVLRLQTPKRAVVVGAWAEDPARQYPVGKVVPVRPGSDLERAIESDRPIGVSEHPPGAAIRGLGYRSTIVAPIRVGNRLWGVLAVADYRSQPRVRDEQRLQNVAELLATAIASIEDRAKLAAQASSDPLTGLANHRSLHETLSSEVSRAGRSGGSLSVAVLDVDQFKQLNDSAGHEAGDRLLVGVADCLRQVARGSDTLGRVGGDEFAWILPDTDSATALVAVERARRLVSETLSGLVTVTVSAGICDLSVTEDPAELIRLADGALYWSKAHGRDQCWVYDPEVVAELSAQDRAERLAHSQAVVGLRALAQAIDAKDPATRRHSDRVARLAHRLAQLAGWSPEQARLLSDAALVHDVGKIGVPDGILRKAGRLSESERTQIRTHAELAARIVDGVLSPQQVDWIRHHHERPDGTGYPRGLVEAQIPEGALLLAMADAWDVMTVSRPHAPAKTLEQALRESRALAGLQFSLGAVAALEELHRQGELPALARDATPAAPAAAESVQLQVIRAA